MSKAKKSLAKASKVVKVSRTQKVIRHLAAFKAHLTMAQNRLKAAKKPDEKKAAREAIARLSASIKATA